MAWYMPAYYAIPKDPEKLKELEKACTRFVKDPDSQNLFGLYLLNAIEELKILREQVGEVPPETIPAHICKAKLGYFCTICKRGTK